MVSGISSPELIWRNLIPVIMAGVNGIYGLITAIVIMGAIDKPQGEVNKYSLFNGFAHLAAGLCCGLCGLCSGMAIGIAGNSSVMSCGYYDHQSKKMKASGGFMGQKKGGKKKKGNDGDKLFVVMVLIQVFAGNLALYGLITSIILSSAATFTCDE